MSDIAREVHDIIQKWTQRGYIVPDIATDIEDDLQGAIRPTEPFPELRKLADNERAVDLGMRCHMQMHEEKLARIQGLLNNLGVPNKFMSDHLDANDVRTILDGDA